MLFPKHEKPARIRASLMRELRETDTCEERKSTLHFISLSLKDYTRTALILDASNGALESFRET